MCGRYYIDGALETDVKRIVQEIDRSMRRGRTGDIYPTDMAPVIYKNRNVLRAMEMKWGLVGKENKPLVNARAETALERPTFSDSVRYRRCIIPARHFYEWNRDKQKVTFCYPRNAVIYMTGFYQLYEDGPHFIIVTTSANDSVCRVHDRMPLIIEEAEIEAWIHDNEKVSFFLRKPSPMLEYRMDFEQLSMF